MASRAILDFTLFLLYINNLLDDVICNITIYAGDTTLYSKCNWASDLWQHLQLDSELELDLCNIVDWGRKWLFDFNAEKFSLKKFNASMHLTVRSNCGAIDVKKKMNQFLMENRSFMCWDYLSIITWIEALTLSLLLKRKGKEIGALTSSTKFLFFEVALYLHKSFIRSCMKYCCYVSAGTWICWISYRNWKARLDSVLTISLKPLPHRRNVASLSLF